MHSYFEVSKNLPSRLVAYPKGIKVSVRGMYYPEVVFFSEHRDRFSDVVDMLKREKAVLVEGLDFDDLTIGDFYYCFLLILDLSFERMTYTFGRKCPSCKGKIKEIDLGIGGVPNPKVKGNIDAKVEVAEIDFKTIEDDIVTQELDSETNCLVFVNLEEEDDEVPFDFYRVKHLQKILNSETEDGKSPLKQSRLKREMVEFSYRLGMENLNNLTTRDIQILRKADGYMDHGPNGKANGKCPYCQHKEALSYSWEDLSFVPFRVTEESAGDRIRIGKRAKSAVKRTGQDGVQKGRASVPKVVRTSGERENQEEPQPAG